MYTQRAHTTQSSSKLTKRGRGSSNILLMKLLNKFESSIKQPLIQQHIDKGKVEKVVNSHWIGWCRCPYDFRIIDSSREAGKVYSETLKEKTRQFVFFLL